MITSRELVIDDIEMIAQAKRFIKQYTEIADKYPELKPELSKAIDLENEVIRNLNQHMRRIKYER